MVFLTSPSPLMRVERPKLKLKQPLVAGHSLGGALSLAIALDHPDCAGGLALIAPSVEIATRKRFGSRRDALDFYRPMLQELRLRNQLIMSGGGETGVGIASLELREIAHVIHPLVEAPGELGRNGLRAHLLVGERSEAAELRNARRPKVVGALDDLGNSGRYLIWVLHRKQIGPHSLVN